MHLSRTLLGLCLLLQTLPVMATRPTLNPQQKIKIVYGSLIWNKKANVVDRIFVLIRETTTGRIYRTELMETAPDSASFETTINLPWTDLQKVQPEVYAPTLRDVRNKKTISAFTKKVNEQKIQRNPILVKTFRHQLQVIDVYDSLNESQKALAEYKSQLAEENAQLIREKELNKALPKLRDEELAIKAEKIATLKKLNLEAAAKQSERLKQEQEEKKQMARWKAEQIRLHSTDKKRRKAKAKTLGDKALKLYKEKKYQKSAPLFRQAMKMDPKNGDYPFFYGISLYKNNRYNEALVILSASQTNPIYEVEKKYFMGLIHYKSKELLKASINFYEARKSKHEIFAPASAFYIGLIYYDREKYLESKTFFEEVIDTSKDPRLDDKSEVYLDLIARSLKYKKNRAKTYTINGATGLGYDTNILTAADNEVTQGTPGLADDREGFRFNLNGDATYHFLYNEKNDWSAYFSTYWIKSINSVFRRADYWQSSVGSPYRWKGSWRKKPFSISLNPQTDYLVMYDTNDQKERNIMSSYSLSSEIALIMSDSWMSNYVLGVTREDSFLANSVGIEDADSLKFILSTRQNFFLNRSRSRAYIPFAQYVVNNANGKNKAYKRILLGITYAAPWKYKINWNASASIYYLTFPTSEDKREDTNLTLGIEVTRPMAADWVLALSSNASNNFSTESTNRYNRYTVMASARFNWSK